MKTPHFRFSRLLGAIFLPLLIASLSVGDLIAQQTTGSGAPSINFQILSSRKVNVGDHSVVYNRVAPPVIPAPLALPTAVPTLSPAHIQWEESQPQKVMKCLMLMPTVYDHQFSDFTWTNGTGCLRVISNIDFNSLTGFEDIETPDTIYENILFTFNSASNSDGLDSQTLAYLAQARMQLSSTRAGYIIVEGNAAVNPDVLADLDAIHSYYNANKTQVITAYHQREAAWELQEAWNKAHPPIPKDTVVNFWPIKSAVYQRGGNQ